MRISKRSNILLAVVLVSGLFLGGVSATVEAAEGAAFYKGRTIEFVVGTSPGGGYDTWARLLVPYLEKYTGAKNIIVRNIPGAAFGKSLDYVYHSKGTGGIMMLLCNGISMALTELLDFPETNLRWDSSKFNYIGRVTRDYNALLTSPTCKTITDVKAKDEFLIVSDSPLGSGSIHGALYIEGLGLTNAKRVFGWAGGTEQRLALIQGMIHGETSSFRSAEQFYKSGELTVFTILAKERLKEAPDVPTIWEFKPSADAAKWLTWMDSIDAHGRLIIAPPDVPEDRVAVLRNALAKSITDPGFLKSCNKIGYTPLYLPPAEIKNMVTKASLTEAKRKELLYLMKEKWIKK